ncbi:unnamed protein product [Albugo candida]|uniref:Uncharacterized protein n=1 Tax=Albugo candida TaxID=65357 RepID=A0A024GQ44_9STRA|nr:unnamed protein product [Albugo candida]|eukprot:CCI48999.1 unnamed protein product [Albugo candida]
MSERNRFMYTNLTASICVIRHQLPSNAWNTKTDTFQTQSDNRNQAVDETAANMRGQAAMKVPHKKLRDRLNCVKNCILPHIRCAFVNAFGLYAFLNYNWISDTSSLVDTWSLAPSMTQYSLPSSNPPDSTSLSKSLEQLDISLQRASIGSEPSQNLVVQLLPPQRLFQR